MIRLPPSGIDISQNDLNFHLQQLDIYQGLLKQGFKKFEIIKYFQTKNVYEEIEQLKSSRTDLTAPSTVRMCAESYISSLEEFSPTKKSPASNDGMSLADKPLSDSTQTSHACEEHLFVPPHNNLSDQPPHSQSHAPRQSSLLRFGQAVSPDSPFDSHSRAKIAISPRSHIAYRPRSETYSYDQSEIDEEETTRDDTATARELEHLSLSQELLPVSEDGTRTTIRVVSNLRAEAEAFTPFHQRLEYVNQDQKGRYEMTTSSSSDEMSFPSSPPTFLPTKPSDIQQRPPSLPGIANTASDQLQRLLHTPDRQTHRQYFDGSFTVYDDSVPARLQPQTPADLSRGQYLDELMAAYTAPPGVIRSPLLPRSRHSRESRQASDEQSPTRRAILMRERRQREFVRGARVEGLIINRVRNDGPMAQTAWAEEVNNFWRDNLDADAVGEENFEDPVLIDAFRRLRTISGNRRAT